MVKQNNDFGLIPTCVNEEFEEDYEQTIGCQEFLDGTHSIFIPSIMTEKVVNQLSSGVMIILQDLDQENKTFIPTFCE